MHRNLSEYWQNLHKRSNGWLHAQDEQVLSVEEHTFNLDYPPPAFVGDVDNAPIIVLAANGGYDPVVTREEFESAGAEDRYLERLASPSVANWLEVAPYYRNINYAELVFSGKAAIVNACAYRSPKISEEPENRRLVKRLPSTKYHKTWLLEKVFPLARSGDRLIVGKRHGLWNLPDDIKHCDCFIADPAPVSPHLSKVVLRQVENFLS